MYETILLTVKHLIISSLQNNIQFLIENATQCYASKNDGKRCTNKVYHNNLCKVHSKSKKINLFQLRKKHVYVYHNHLPSSEIVKDCPKCYLLN